MLLLFAIWGIAIWKMQRRGGPLSFDRNKAKVRRRPDLNLVAATLLKKETLEHEELEELLERKPEKVPHCTIAIWICSLKAREKRAIRRGSQRGQARRPMRNDL